MILSVIIPIYNTPIDILKRCIDTISKIINIKYEIILVNDGSNEKLTRKYNELCNKYIKVYNKKNGGVSSARNYGIGKAKGKYILFVDSDDVIIPKNIDYQLLKENYDIIFYNLSMNKNDTIIDIKEITNHKSGEIYYIDVLKDFVSNEKFYSPVAKLINREFLQKNNIKFNTSMINGEDAIFNLDMLLNKPKMYYKNISIYLYYYSLSNYEKRIEKSFDNIISDYLYKFNRKKEVIIKNSFSSDIIKKIENSAVKQVFKMSMICSKLKKNKKNEMCNYIKEFSIMYNNLTFINKIKYTIIRKKMWLFVSFASKARTLYQKIK